MTNEWCLVCNSCLKGYKPIFFSSTGPRTFFYYFIISGMRDNKVLTSVEKTVRTITKECTSTVYDDKIKWKFVRKAGDNFNSSSFKPTKLEDLTQKRKKKSNQSNFSIKKSFFIVHFSRWFITEIKNDMGANSTKHSEEPIKIRLTSEAWEQGEI